MDLYRTLYYRLYAQIANAVDAMDRLGFAEAQKILMDAMLQAEEVVISAGDEDKEVRRQG